MAQEVNRILITGATGYIADQMLPTFRDRYETILVDTRKENRRGESVDGLHVADLSDPNNGKYIHLFNGVDAVVHLAYMRRTGKPIDHFDMEKRNVEMAYNVLRASYESGVRRVVMASSNHASDWHEHALIHCRQLDQIHPYDLPLSDNFYGWAKASYEHLGFVFACGAMGEYTDGASRNLVTGGLGTSRKMGVVMVRIGAPRELESYEYRGDPVAFKRDLGAYISARDITQLFQKAMEVPNIENKHGVPWQVVYGISDNTRSFWSLSSAREVFGYEPQDDSEIKFSSGIREILSDVGRVGPVS